jgi:hypothetical protein
MAQLGVVGLFKAKFFMTSFTNWKSLILGVRGLRKKEATCTSHWLGGLASIGKALASYG